MALMSCPECHRQVSARAPACPSCGYPIAAPPPAPAPQVIIQQPAESSGIEKIIVAFFALALGIFLGISNPSEADMRTRVLQDGWAPVGFERTNLVLFNWVSVTGFTGAKGKYVGVAGMIFKL